MRRGAKRRLMGKGSLIVFATLLAVFNVAWQAAPADGINGSLAQLDLTGQQLALGAAMTPMSDASAVSSFVWIGGNKRHRYARTSRFGAAR